MIKLARNPKRVDAFPEPETYLTFAVGDQIQANVMQVLKRHQDQGVWAPFGFSGANNQGMAIERIFRRGIASYPTRIFPGSQASTHELRHVHLPSAMSVKPPEGL